jgi:hypothetical protein
VCQECNARREQDADRTDPPKCGAFSDEKSDYPDGGWVRVQMFFPHKDIQPTDEIVSGNPFQAELDEKVRLERERLERDRMPPFSLSRRAPAVSMTAKDDDPLTALAVERVKAKYNEKFLTHREFDDEVDKELADLRELNEGLECR